MADVEFLIHEIRRGRPLLIGLAVFVFAVAGGAALIPVEDGAAAWVSYGRVALIGLFVVTAVLCLVTAFKNPMSYPGIVLLTREPQRIVWAHVARRVQNGMPVGAVLWLHTDAGARVELLLPSAPGSSERALALVQQVAPHAAQGYSPERDALFARDPAALRRGA